MSCFNRVLANTDSMLKFGKQRVDLNDQMRNIVDDEELPCYSSDINLSNCNSSRVSIRFKTSLFLAMLKLRRKRCQETIQNNKQFKPLKRRMQKLRYNLKRNSELSKKLVKVRKNHT